MNTMMLPEWSQYVYRPTTIPRNPSLLPDGQISKIVSSPFRKNISVFPNRKSAVELLPSHPRQGRFAIVTNAGWDAVDAGSVRHAQACWTKTLVAYGEVVWSWRRGAGVKSAKDIPPATEAKEPFSGESTR
jgi:hypothetical protein